MAEEKHSRLGWARPLGLGPAGLLPNLYDVVIFILIAAVFVGLAHGAREMMAPTSRLTLEPVTLDPATCRNMPCARRCACSPPSSPR